MKTVNVEEDTWANLMKLKIDLKLDSLDAVVLYLIKKAKPLEVRVK